jgi:hypothetical protein
MWMRRGSGGRKILFDGELNVLRCFEGAEHDVKKIFDVVLSCNQTRRDQYNLRWTW